MASGTAAGRAAGRGAGGGGPAVRGGPGKPDGWRHPGWSWTVRQGGMIAAGWGLATLLLGAALGGVYALITGDWHKGTTWGELWLTVGLTVVAVAIAIGCLASMRGRMRMLASNGTAYIIKEQARGWDTDDAGKFLAETRRQFARVISVPGPATLDKGWDWALDDAASHWDDQLDALAVAFRALHADDDPSSPNGVFMWAWWSVAMAFGLRVVSAERGLELDVWQRPSFGRTAQEEPVPWASRPHAFGAVTQPVVTPLEFEWPACLTTTQAAGLRPVPEGGSAAAVTVLLIRVGREEWGGIPNAGATPGPEPGHRYDLDIRDAASVCVSGKANTVVHELRYDVPIRSVPWHDYPALVTACADWIVRQAGSLHGQVLLLGMVVPQEVSLGLGIRAGHAAHGGWPSRLWPLVYDSASGGFVVPRLNLGTAPLDLES